MKTYNENELINAARLAGAKIGRCDLRRKIKNITFYRNRAGGLGIKRFGIIDGLRGCGWNVSVV